MKHQFTSHTSLFASFFRYAGGFLAGLALCAVAEVQAREIMPQQERPPHADEIRELKIGFFSDALQLTPEQSQRFWPVYNAYWNARRELGRKRHTAHRAIREGRDAERQFEIVLGVMDAERKLMADYMTKFRQILPADKAARVFVTDEDFKNFLIRKVTQKPKPEARR
ncbi:Spy/CpxP family protein refolding chaperone [uncultured Rikenella sp.]|uniref:Spy/CpxP family protein refolding chaperone n=1 Tax=uncultured Rikenella sp. TaxID=368003 RepID=UPI0025FC706D|nr:Spy/CpxP family protein refolding chaperone [uncultured Rikenella sp.]